MRPFHLVPSISVCGLVIVSALTAHAKTAPPRPPEPPPPPPSAQPATNPAGSPSGAAQALPPPPPPPAGMTAAPPPPAGAAPPPGYPGYYPPPGYPNPYAGRSLDEEEQPYFEGATVPPGYHVETRVRKAPVIAGAVMLGTGYLIPAIGAVSAVSAGSTEFAPLFIPVVGPFVTVGNLDFGGELGGLGFIVLGIPLILDGLLQTAGAITLIVGATSHKKVVVVGPPAALDTRPHVGVAGNRLIIEGRF